jgi:serine/threonine protein kinase
MPNRCWAVSRQLAYNGAVVQELQKGLVIGESYELLALIGRGGMGEVWMARHLRLPRHVAVKVLLSDGRDHKEWISRFAREVEITSKLGHPNIVEVLDANSLADGRPYYVMELLEGETLRQRLRRGRLPFDEALDLLRQIASGLHAAHSAGVIHRDLKPENIYLARVSSDFGAQRELVKIVDFGVARRQDDEVLTRADSAVGSTPYMAPEQATGKVELFSPRIDQFALAAIACEMLLGQRLFAGRSTWETTYQVVKERPKGLDQLQTLAPMAFYRAIERALDKDPEKRHSDVVAFYQALAEEGDEETCKDIEPQNTEVGQTSSAAVEAASSAGPVGRDTLPDGPTIAERPPSPKARGGRSKWIALAVLVGAIALGAAVWQLSKAPKRGANKRPRQHLAAQKPDTAVALSAGHRARAPDSGVSRDAKLPLDAAGCRDLAGRDLAARRKPQSGAKNTRQKLKRPRDPQVAASLRAAKAALAQKDFRKALQHGMRALRKKPGPAVFFTLGQAYCGERNLGMVRAMLRNLSKSAKARLKRYCRKVGMAVD